jgi:D-lyxose ketol-isomerase
VQRIVDRRLRWDMTDFGSEDFNRVGLSLFTLRNGALGDLDLARGELYCEKALIVGVKQVTPLHYHWAKTEDIINRGGGTLAVQLYNATEDGALADDDVTVYIDGIRRQVPAGGILTLDVGESITLRPCCYHAFWAEGSRSWPARYPWSTTTNVIIASTRPPDGFRPLRRMSRRSICWSPTMTATTRRDQ